MRMNTLLGKMPFFLPSYEFMINPSAQVINAFYQQLLSFASDYV